MGQTNSSHEIPRRNVQELPRCSKCKKLLIISNPRKLSCRHILCPTCIIDVYSSTIARDASYKGRINCPVCSQVTSFTDDDSIVKDVKSFDKYVHVTKVSTPPSVDGVTESKSSVREEAFRSVPSTIENDPDNKKPSPIVLPYKLDTCSPSPKQYDPDDPELLPTTAPDASTSTVGTGEVPRTPLKRVHPDTSDDSSGDEDFHDTQQEPSDLPVSPMVDLHLCNVCKQSKPKRRRTEAAFYCFDCTSPMCEGCRGKHDFRPRCKDHVCCSVTKDSIVSLVCQKHQEYTEDYCIDCKCVTCAECHVSHHRGHNIRNFTIHDVESTMFRELAQRKAKNIRTIVCVDDYEKRYMEELTNNKDEMKKWRNDIIGAINTQFESMFSTMENAQDTWSDRVNDLRRSIQTEDDLLDELQERSDRLVSPIAAIKDLHIQNAQDLLVDLRKELPRHEHVVSRPDTYIYIPDEGVKRKCGQLVQVPSSETNAH